MEENKENLEKVVDETVDNVSEEDVATDTKEEVVDDASTTEADKDSKKVKAKKKKKDKKDEQIEELNDRLLRTMAEFENFRTRTEKEKKANFEIGAKSIIEKILPVVDNFERGLAGIAEDAKEDPFVQGMEGIYKQMTAALDEMGVKPIEAVGKEFDPEFHNAVMHEDNDEYGENEISQELQKGYMYKDSVVRHSMVKVCN